MRKKVKKIPMLKEEEEKRKVISLKAVKNHNERTILVSTYVLDISKIECFDNHVFHKVTKFLKNCLKTRPFYCGSRIEFRLTSKTERRDTDSFNEHTALKVVIAKNNCKAAKIVKKILNIYKEHYESVLKEVNKRISKMEALQDREFAYFTKL